MSKSLPLVILLALSLVGCTKAVEITGPVAPLSAPITEFEVKFASDFTPGTFRAELDGHDVTSRFAPTAVAGGTSWFQVSDSGEGFSECLSLGVSVPQPVPVGIDTRPADGRPSSGSSGPTAGGRSGSGGGGKPIPKITLCHHKLRVTGLCTGMICDTADELYVFPLHLVPIPTNDLSLRIGQSADIRLETYPPNSVPIQVSILPSSVSVRLNQAAPGAPITVWIPANEQSPSFSVTGMVDGNLLLFLDARGTQRGSISGVVNR